MQDLSRMTGQRMRKNPPRLQSRHIDMLGTLAMYGNLRRTDLYRHSRMSYGRFVEYIEYMKWKNLIVEEDSYIVMNERGRMLYSFLA